MTLLSRDEKNKFHDRGGQIFEANSGRTQLVQAIQNGLGIPTEANDSVDSAGFSSVQADFFSLGYCYLQIQLMTRQLRYSSSLDELQFQGALIQAVKLAAKPESENYPPAIQACFDLLAEERDRYYPTTANLIDLAYVTADVPEKHLQAQLAAEHSLNWHVTGDVVDSISKSAELVQAIRTRCENGTLSLVGGELQEIPGVIQSTRLTLSELEMGVCRLQDLIPDWDPIFARRTFGLHVGLPAVLSMKGFDRAIHSTLDEGVFPQTSPNHIRWEGDDGTTINALVAPPRLASADETWLNLGVKVGEVIDAHHYASLLFVHWPGQESDYYRDVIHSRRFGAILGNFVTLTEYFENVGDPGYSQSYLADDYRDPFLKQLVARKAIDPISRFQRDWKATISDLACEGMTAMCHALGQERLPCGSPSTENARSTKIAQVEPRQYADDPEGLTAIGLAKSLANQEAKNTVTIFNPFSFPRRIAAEISNADTAHPAVVCCSDSEAIVDVPSMGFVSVPCNSRTSHVTANDRSVPSMAEDVFLRNEFFEVEIDEVTGGIGAIKFYGKRKNLLGQQLAFRETRQGQSRSGRQEVTYSRMIAEDIQVTDSTGTRGVIVSSGRLELAGKSIANFKQTTTLHRALPIVDIDFQLDLKKLPVGSPWANYCCCRFAWQDALAEYYSWHNETRHRVVRNRVVAPLALEIDQHDFRTTVLTGGLPFHQRIGDNRLDSLLVVKGESQRTFKLSIGVDLKRTLATAMGQLIGVNQVLDAKPTVNADHAWLFHLNCRNVVVLKWTQMSDGRGVRILIRETENRRCELKLSCLHELKSVQVFGAGGQTESEPVPEGNHAIVSVCACELMELALFW